MPATSEAVLDRILAERIVPNFSNDRREAAVAVTEAVLAGGVSVVEYTNRHPESLNVFSELARHVRVSLPGLLLGAGTVTTPAEAERFVAAGAAFVVGPNFHAGIASLCLRTGVLYIPGCATATEVASALGAGARLIKLFPAAQLGGPASVRALLGPFPNARFMPSGGVSIDIESIGAWFTAGAACLGIGNELFPKAAIEARDWRAISRLVARAAAAARPVAPP